MITIGEWGNLSASAQHEYILTSGASIKGLRGSSSPNQKRKYSSTLTSHYLFLHFHENEKHGPVSRLPTLVFLTEGRTESSVTLLRSSAQKQTKQSYYEVSDKMPGSCFCSCDSLLRRTIPNLTPSHCHQKDRVVRKKYAGWWTEMSSSSNSYSLPTAILFSAISILHQNSWKTRKFCRSNRSRRRKQKAVVYKKLQEFLQCWESCRYTHFFYFHSFFLVCTWNWVYIFIA